MEFLSVKSVKSSRLAKEVKKAVPAEKETSSDSSEDDEEKKVASSLVEEVNFVLK